MRIKMCTQCLFSSVFNQLIWFDININFIDIINHSDLQIYAVKYIFF